MTSHTKTGKTSNTTKKTNSASTPQLPPDHYLSRMRTVRDSGIMKQKLLKAID